MMKIGIATLLAVMITTLTPARAQDTNAPASSQKRFGGTVVESQQVRAKVTKINERERKLTLKDEQGRTATFIAGPEIVNFDQIKKGDTINLTSTETVTVWVTGAGAARPKSEEQTTEVQRAQKGNKPAGQITETERVYAVVEDVDRANRTVTLKGPERTLTVKVGPEARNFDQVKVGDNVELQTVSRIAVAVTK